jgi:hypothetical protein
MVLILELLDIVGGLDKALLIIFELLHQVIFGALEFTYFPHEILLTSNTGSPFLLNLVFEEFDFFLVEITLTS